MTDLIDDVKKRLDNIRERAAVLTKQECIEYLESRIHALKEDIDVFGPTANDKEQLRLLKQLLKDVKNDR